MADWESQTSDTGPPVGSYRLIKNWAALLLAGISAIATTIISIGGYHTASSGYPSLTGWNAMPYATMGWGLTALVISILAQWTIHKPERRFVGCIIILTGIASVGMGLTATVSLTNEYTIDDQVANNFHSHLRQYQNGTVWTDEIDTVQVAFSCCGHVSRDDYQAVAAFRHGEVPISCCRKPAPGCGNPPLNNIHETGCGTPLTESMETSLQHCTISLAVIGAAMTALWITMMVVWTFIL